MCSVCFPSCCFLSSSNVKTFLKETFHGEENEGKEMNSLCILNTGEVRAIYYDRLAHSSCLVSLRGGVRKKILPAFLLNQLKIRTTSRR